MPQPVANYGFNFPQMVIPSGTTKITATLNKGEETVTFILNGNTVEGFVGDGASATAPLFSYGDTIVFTSTEDESIFLG